MELQTFVSSTILQIIRAVSEAQGAAAELGGAVNPTLAREDASRTRIGSTAAGQPVYAIEFDVAITTGTESGTEGGASIKVASVLSIGGKGRGNDRHESVSRIKFMVPIVLPLEAKTTAERDERDRLAAERKREQDALIEQRLRQSTRPDPL